MDLWKLEVWKRIEFGISVGTILVNSAAFFYGNGIYNNIIYYWHLSRNFMEEKELANPTTEYTNILDHYRFYFFSRAFYFLARRRYANKTGIPDSEIVLHFLVLTFKF